MTKEEIMLGESKNVEFKVSLPGKMENLTKTIIAFANTQGGKLIIGIDDETREIVGVDHDDVFHLMDTIANAVDDACVPQIIPEIEPKSVDGKTLIIVTIVPGPNRPYYLNAKGKERGTYIRSAGTSRLATQDKIRELEMEGARVSWDELNCVDFPVENNAVEKLCSDIMLYRKNAGLPEKEVTVTQLLNWKVLKNANNHLLATNAFALLTSNHFFFSRTQCAVFKGTDRNVFLDKREYCGPLYEQIEATVEFVLRNIRLGARINGLLRKEEYELPVEAIREIIINAHCHRNMLDDACVQVAIYDDRLEVTSPGGLYNGLTHEEMLQGRSRLRNKAIANVFNQMGLIEAWGSGIRRVFEAMKSFGLDEPEFLEFDDTFRINLYRLKTESKTNTKTGTKTSTKTDTKTGTKTSTKTDTKTGTSSSEKMLVLIRNNPSITLKQMMALTGLSRSGVRYALTKFREKGIVSRTGSRKSGYWKISGSSEPL